MKTKIFVVIQILAGLMLVVFGLNKFLQFMPMPPAPESMANFLGALFKTGYMFPLIATIQILSGLAFITNKFAPLMAIVLLPVMLNAFLAHLFLDPAGIGGSAFLMVAIIVVMVRHASRYTEVLKP